MSDKMRKAAVWLGLVADDGAYQDANEVDELTEEVNIAEEAPKEDNVTDLESRRPAPRPAPMADLSKIITIHPRTYNEAKTIGENFRDGIPIIMNLSEMDDSDAKRLVDFAAGLTFGLAGTIERVTSRVFLLSPPSVTIAAEDKERLADGFYNQS